MGLERALAGAKTIFQVEISPFCRRILQNHWPDSRRFEDVNDFHWSGPPPTILCGGFPCQDISQAGRGVGLNGSRSRLWFQFLRIIQETQPEVVCVENSPMLRTRGLVTVLQGLATSGYDAEWDVLSAAASGAPHERKRLYLIAYPMRESLRGQGGRPTPIHNEIGVGAAPVWEPQQPSGSLSLDVADANVSHGKRECVTERIPPKHTLVDRSRFGVAQRRVWGEAPPPFRRVDDGVPRGLDRARLMALGNAVVPDVAYRVGLRVKEILGV